MYDVKAIPHMTEDSPLNPPGEKGKVRAEIANMLMAEVKSRKLTGMIVRSADFYGANKDKSFLIEVGYKNILKRKRPNWFMDAGKRHAFTYTPEAAKATTLLAHTEGTFN